MNPLKALTKYVAEGTERFGPLEWIALILGILKILRHLLQGDGNGGLKPKPEVEEESEISEELQ